MRRWIGLVALFAVLGLWSVVGQAAEATKPAPQAAAQQTPLTAQQTPLWPPFAKIEAQLQQWQRAHPAVMKLDVLGRSAEGRPIYAARLTDPDSPEDAKEHALITAQHSGIERSATVGVLYLMQWLLSDDRTAREILRRQVVVLMPVVNPDGYMHGTHANTKGKDPYNTRTLNGPADAAAMPEAVAVQKVMDQHQPEVHADYHGLDLSFPQYIMLENSGASYSNVALRPYHQRIIHLMDEAARAGGFPSDTAEDGAERLVWGPELNAIANKLWWGRPRPYAALYCYNRYHSLVLASEILWPQSGLLRHRRLLEIGNETWPGEYYAGYPTRVISRNNMHAIVAYGATAAARRRSRVELWSKVGQFTHGMDVPQCDGTILYVCATSPAAAGKWLRDKTLAGFARAIRDKADINTAPILEMIAQHPAGAGQWGPTAQFSLTAATMPAAQAKPIENGLAIQLRIPYGKARLTALQLNGRPLAASATDGYTQWVAEAYTNVQVNIPPEVSQKQDLFVITCRYEPGENRARGWPVAE